MGPYGDFYLPRWLLVCLIAQLFIAFKIYWKTNIFLGIAALYVMAQPTFYILGIPQNVDYTPHASTLFEHAKAVILPMSFFTLFSFIKVKEFYKYLPDLLIINIVWTILANIFDWKYSGFSLNTSVNATTLSIMCVACINHRYRVFYGCFTVVAILLSSATMGLVSLIGGASIYFIVTGQDRARSGILSGVLLALSVALAYLIYGSELHSFSGRLPVWEMVLNYIIESKNYWTGFGFGSFASLIPKLQKYYNIIPKVMFTWAHNDYLQLFFEGGILGCVIFLTAGIRTLWDSFSTQKYLSFAVLVTYLINCVGNFPTRVALDIFIVFTMVVLIYEKEKTFKPNQRSNVQGNGR